MPGSPLFVRVFGTGPDVVALHGFTLTGSQFAPIAGPDLRIHAPDLPGHGRSADLPATLPATVAALERFLRGFERPMPLVGYSQGGRVALLTALEYPELVDRLVLVSTSPGIPDAAARNERRSRDHALADRIESIGLAAFLDEWLAGPVAGTAHVDEARRVADRRIREENTAAGLAAALRGMGQGSQPYVGDRLPAVTVPVLLITGERDHRYRVFADSMAEAFPNARRVSVPGAGHNVILEAPDRVCRLVTDFVGTTTP